MKKALIILLVSCKVFFIYCAYMSQNVAITTRIREIEEDEDSPMAFFTKRLLFAAIVSLVLSGVGVLLFWICRNIVGRKWPDIKLKRVFVYEWLVFFLSALVAFIVNMFDLLG